MKEEKKFLTTPLVLVVGILTLLVVFLSFELAAVKTNSSVQLEAQIKKVITDSLPAVFTVVSTLKPEVKAKTHPEHMTGSAFAFKSSGADLYLITNFHVIENADSIFVVDYRKREIAAQLVGSDPLKDIAVLKIFNAYSVKPLKINSGPYTPGTFVVALGSPFAFMNSASFGIISASDRSLNTKFGYEINGVLQVDAPINQGNSGGPLLNLRGEVVGVNSAIFTLSRGFEGIGFAIPAFEAKRIAERIIDEGEKVIKLFGISCADFDRSVANAFNLPVDGVLVICLYPESALAKAGIRGTKGTPGGVDFELGDIILKVNGKTVKTVGDIARAVQNEKKVLIEYYRNGNIYKTEVVLE